MRERVWSVGRNGVQLSGFIQDLDVNGVEAAVMDGDGVTIRRDRFVIRELAENASKREHARLLAEGWTDEGEKPCRE
jgi:hypothetical protein